MSPQTAYIGAISRTSKSSSHGRQFQKRISWVEQNRRVILSFPSIPCLWFCLFTSSGARTTKFRIPKRSPACVRMAVEEASENDCQVAKPVSNSKKLKRKKKRVKMSLVNVSRPSASEGISLRTAKYWYHRYSLFSRYDDGIKMDEEGWFSVTPEEIAVRHAERSGTGTVIDCFSGVGGNAIQFAKRCYHVVAIDIDAQKVEMAFNNAKIYGVEDYIDFIVGDFFQLAPFLKGDVVFLSPPWGGPTYSTIDTFTLDLLKPKDGYSMFRVARNITHNIIMFLPRNVDLNQVEELSWLSSPPLNLEMVELSNHQPSCTDLGPWDVTLEDCKWTSFAGIVKRPCNSMPSI